MLSLFKLIILIFCELLLIEHVFGLASECVFCIGSISELTGHGDYVGEWLAGGYQMAVRDFLDGELPELTKNILSLNDTCILSLDLRDFASSSKIAIQQIFDLSATFDKRSADQPTSTVPTLNQSCSVNMPFIVGPSTSGDTMTTNPIPQAFNLLQFAPVATATFLSSYPFLYRPIPSDDVQAKALIDLCFHFNWDKVGILYMASDYGTSLQRAITSYANIRNIKSTTYSYIARDNVTLENSVQSMRNSQIYIFILIVYDGDMTQLSALLRHHNMKGYPYYYLSTDGWLYSSVFQHPQSLDLFGGLVGTCPWAPRMDDTLPYPMNISLAMYTSFYRKWKTLQANKEYHITFNRSDPAIFSVYAYDTVLIVIKLIDEFIYRNDITTIDTFWTRLHSETATSEFVEILNEMWLMGLTGNITFSQHQYEAGDRMQGLFSYCNIDPVTGGIHQIGYHLANEVRVNESSINWPLYSYSDSPIPMASYVSKNNGITDKSGMGLPVFIWLCIFLSIVTTIIYLSLLYFYRNMSLVRAAQWKLNLFMVVGCMVCYISLLLQGVDESFPAPKKDTYNWNLLCNVRFFTLNLSFSLIYGPLCAKIYRIDKIFKSAMIELRGERISDQTLFMYNFIWSSIDSSLCLVLLILAPFNRQYEAGEMVNYVTTKWGSCVTPVGWIYVVVLGAPKLIFSLYCITLSISAHSTVSMMKFNEGLQVLVCIVVSSILIFVTVLVVAGTTVNSATQSVFVYSFMSFMVLMVCHFCCAVMVLPRIFAIWRGHDEEAVHDEAKAATEYLKKLKLHLNKVKDRFTEDESKMSDTSRDGASGTITIEKCASYSVSSNHVKKVSHQSELLSEPTPMRPIDLPPLAQEHEEKESNAFGVESVEVVHSNSDPDTEAVSNPNDATNE